MLGSFSYSQGIYRNLLDLDFMFQESSFCIILLGAWEMESLFPFYLGERVFLLLISLSHHYGVKKNQSPCFHKWVSEVVKKHMYHIMGACSDKWPYTVIMGD